MIAVLAVSSQPMLLEGLRAFIKAEGDLSLAGTAMTLVDALEAAGHLSPDVIVLDASLLSMDRFAVIRDLASPEPGRAVVLLAESEDHLYIDRALQVGSKAYVLKRSPRECLHHGIFAAATGGIYLDPAVAANYLPLQKRIRRQNSSGEVPLGAREAEVIRLVALGFTIKEIATQLNVTPKTIETHKARGCEKLHLTTRAQIVRYAASNGWLQDLPSSD